MWAVRSIPWKPYRSTNSAVRLYQDNQTMASLFLPFQNICAQVHATTCPTIFLQLELHAAPSLTRSAFRYSFFRCFSLFLIRIENYLKIKTKSKSNQIEAPEHTLCACFLCDNGRSILSLLWWCCTQDIHSRFDVVCQNVRLKLCYTAYTLTYTPIYKYSRTKIG